MVRLYEVCGQQATETCVAAIAVCQAAQIPSPPAGKTRR